MGYSLKPLACNGLCRACYENNIRTYNLLPNDYPAMLLTWKKVVKEGKEKGYYTPVLHGGEPLMIPQNWLERFLKVVYREYKETSIQTNLILLNDTHVKLFKKYNTLVGVSLDGPNAEMNLGRWNAGNLPQAVIEKLTQKVLDNIHLLRKENIKVSLIVLLRKYNISGENIYKLRDFALKMHAIGVNSIRFNPVIVYTEEAKEEEPTSEELIRAYKVLCDEAYTNPALEWNPCRDFVKALTGQKNVTCIFRSCDPWHTQAEIPVLGHGGLGNCMHGGAAVDGVPALRTEKPSYEREEILQQIPQENGGCKGCPWWQFCRGGCPGAGLDNDWRNKTRFCPIWKAMFEYVYKKIKGLFPWWEPIKHPFPQVQNNPGNYHGDSHGDRPHGDHTDGGGHGTI